MNSTRYVPTEEQALTSPTCAALAAQGVTEREAIEHLFRQNERLLAHLASLAAFQPIGSIRSGCVVYTNPTADALAAEGHARAMAKMLDAERRAAVEAEREACAKAGVDYAEQKRGGGTWDEARAFGALDVVKLIRARGAR